ncbi:MAG: TetR family transcriptional regulator [Candidatus Tectomicrobia bacterium]
MRTPPVQPSDTRGKILQAALLLFQHKGFEKTTMRDIAADASVAVGAAYYHFKNKDDLVLAFYAQTGAEAAQANLEVIAQTKDFKTRFRAILDFKLQQLLSYRTLACVLARNAAEIDNPLSPFSPQTKAIRDDAIRLIAQAMTGSNLKVAKELLPELSKLLWFYQMGLIFFWSQDASEQQKRTQQLMDQSLSVLLRLMRLSTLPLMGTVNRSVVRILRLIEQIRT